MSASPTHAVPGAESDPPRLSDRYFRLRGYIPIPLYALVVLVRLPVFDHWNLLTWILAPLLVMAGEFLRVWGRMYIGTSSDTRKIKASALVTGGPFNLVRNPLYLGNALCAAGIAVAAELYPLAPVVFLLLLVHYTLVIQSEERLLLANFGEDYRRYRDSIRRWIPGFRRVPSSERREGLLRAVYLDRRQIAGLAAALGIMAVLDAFDLYALALPWAWTLP